MSSRIWQWHLYILYLMLFSVQPMKSTSVAIDRLGHYIPSGSCTDLRAHLSVVPNDSPSLETLSTTDTTDIHTVLEAHHALDMAGAVPIHRCGSQNNEILAVSQ